MKLYKFLRAERAIQVLQDQQLYLMSPGRCNDPFEFRPNVDLSNANVDVVAKAMDCEMHYVGWCRRTSKSDTAESREYYFSHLPELAAEVVQKLPERAQELTEHYCFVAAQAFLIGCFVRDIDSLVMWSHYGDSHQGIVIEFDETRKPFNELSQWIAPVQYDENKPSLQHNFADRMDGAQEKFFRIARWKARCWEYESEVRLIIPITVSCIRDQRYLILAGNSIRSVTFGCKCDSKAIEKAKRILDFGYLRHVAILQAKPSPSEFKLDYEALRPGS